MKLLAEADDNCKDALIAKWSEKDPVKKQILVSIYEENDKKRGGLIKTLAKLTKTWEK